MPGQEPDTELSSLLGAAASLTSIPSAEEAAEKRRGELETVMHQLTLNIQLKERELDELNQHVIRLVQIARREGMPWSRIGQALGISAQAAQQRASRYQLPTSEAGR